MKILITGGAGFIGFHAAEYYARKGNQVIVFDNLSRAKLLGHKFNDRHNWNSLLKNPHIKLIKELILNRPKLEQAAKGVDLIIHAAAQTAVTASLVNPRKDFMTNALGTFNVLEVAQKEKASLIYCSTNKVYGENINQIKVVKGPSRYRYAQAKYRKGVPETFPIDLCSHTPYGASKLAGDIYVQDYAQRHLINAAVFRMSCIYGPRQFGREDQGWIAWFIISTLLDRSITIFGDGKQVRDVLYVDDLITAFDTFVKKRKRLHHGVYNLGGGPKNAISLLELIKILEKFTGKKIKLNFKPWRDSDQKVYISDIRKAKKELGWKGPKIKPELGIEKVVKWVAKNLELFQ